MSDLFAGVDLGGTTIGCALADAAGTIAAEASTPTNAHEGPDGVLARIAGLVRDLAAKAGRPPAAVGLGVPGLADVAAGVVRFLPNLPTHWRDVPAGPRLEADLGCPVHVLNDVRTAALGELAFGHGRTARTMAFVSVGTGVGGGLVIDGRLLLGPLGAAGELGHQTLVPDGPLCGCGNRGCLEALAGGPAVTGEAVRLMLVGQAPLLHKDMGGDPGRVTPRAVARAAAAGDAGAAEAVRRAAVYLGIGVANVVSTIHPDLVVIGGGVAEAGELLLGPVRDEVRRRVRMMPPESVRIERSRAGDRAGVLGGVALAARGGRVS